MNDWIKGPIVLGAFLCFAPALGWLLRGRRAWQRGCFGLMIFMTSWHINKITLMLGSIETYRGHTKGFEANFIAVLALALLVALSLERVQGFRWLAPGVVLWLIHCALCTLSIVVAPQKVYVLMAAWKFSSAIVILGAAYNWLREERDLDFALRAVAGTLLVQMAVVLKMKYVDRIYQVHGWFEHQNPLAMWAYLFGLPLLAAGMSRVGPAASWWFGSGFVASAVIVQASLSRGALVFFAVGVVGTVLLSLIDEPTGKRVRFVAAMGMIGGLGLAATLGTIIARFHDEGNDASAQTRVVLNQASLAMLRDSAVGIGWNNFAITINHPYPYGDVIDDAERAHGHKVDEDYAKGVVESHYWLLLAENGYGGWASYLLFAAVTGWWAVWGAWAGRRTFPGAFLIGLAVALGLIYVHSNLERVLTQTKNLSQWMILLGLVARLETWRRQRRSAPRAEGGGRDRRGVSAQAGGPQGAGERVVGR